MPAVCDTCLSLPSSPRCYRALTIILSSVTLIAHVTTYFVLGAVFAESWGTSWCGLYDVAAVIASSVGVVGAVQVSNPSRSGQWAMRTVLSCSQRRPILVSTYALVHAVTLTTITVVLLVNILPPTIAHTNPLLSRLRYDEMRKGMCLELDDGFGWDEHWVDQCRQSVRILSSCVAWSGLVMMAAQWWAMISIWGWIDDLRKENRRTDDDEANVETGEYRDRLRLKTSLMFEK